MEYLIPLSYNLNINDIDVFYIKYNNCLSINNFFVYYNENGYIYKIKSNIELKYLLDFLYLYKNKVIVKIYNYLIIKYLITLIINIKKQKTNKYNNCFCKVLSKKTPLKPDNIKIVYLREYFITNNDIIKIGTCYIDYNYCLIINNNTIKKTFLAIIDSNCILSCLYKLLDEIYTIADVNFEDIKITLIGGSINNLDILINIFDLLKNMKLSKYIYKTYILNEKPLKSIQYNTQTDEITKLYVELPIEDKSFHKYTTVLHKSM
jgi:hypothetical protein